MRWATKSVETDPYEHDEMIKRGKAQGGPVQAIRRDGGRLLLLDQRALPASVVDIELTDAPGVAQAIRDMVVRGAPAIGVAAAYGGAMSVAQHAQSPNWQAAVEADLQLLEQARPTAVNLAWAIAQVRNELAAFAPDSRSASNADPVAAVLALAQRIHAEDIDINQRIGAWGASLIEQPCQVLTHCNAGALATAGYGTALGVIRSAHAAGNIDGVFAGETRPWLQGARLTAWELIEDEIPVTLIADGAATWAMRQGEIAWVIVGADRVAANGDVANKIGTYSLAVSARHHGVRFMVAAPVSTIDGSCPSGDAIPIEQRDAEEIFALGGVRHAALGADAWNPVFDVTPAELIDALVTENGVIHKPDQEQIARLLAQS